MRVWVFLAAALDLRRERRSVPKLQHGNATHAPLKNKMGDTVFLKMKLKYFRSRGIFVTRRIPGVRSGWRVSSLRSNVSNIVIATHEPDPQFSNSIRAGRNGPVQPCSKEMAPPSTDGGPERAGAVQFNPAVKKSHLPVQMVGRNGLERPSSAL